MRERSGDGCGLGLTIWTERERERRRHKLLGGLIYAIRVWDVDLGLGVAGARKKIRFTIQFGSN